MMEGFLFLIFRTLSQCILDWPRGGGHRSAYVPLYQQTKREKGEQKDSADNLPQDVVDSSNYQADYSKHDCQNDAG